MLSENWFSGHNLWNSCSAKRLPFIDSRLFFQTLVPLCSGRKSLHQFDNPEEETLALIYNYTPIRSASFPFYEQVYFFWASHCGSSPQGPSSPPPAEKRFLTKGLIQTCSWYPLFLTPWNWKPTVHCYMSYTEKYCTQNCLTAKLCSSQ